MLIYSHSTPEILIASFRNKTQVKNSSYCNLIDDTFPDDVMVLKGDDLIIKEGQGTLNLDVALAIGFNAIRDCESARQFAKMYVLNGPSMDTKTLMYYRNRILNGPFGKCVLDYVQSNFEMAKYGVTGDNMPELRNLGTPDIRNNYTKETFQQTIGANENVDNDFISMLKKSLGDCLNAPCDYFSHRGSFGFLTNGAAPNPTTTPTLADKVGPPIDDNETFCKLPPVFQKMSGMLSQIGSTTTKKLTSIFVPKETQKKKEEALDKGKLDPKDVKPAATKPESNNIFNVLKTDISSFLNYSKASSQVQSTISSNLGDCFRMNDYRQRYNPFSYLSNGGMNGEVAADPGISGMPTSTIAKNNGSLNAIATDPTPAPPPTPPPAEKGVWVADPVIPAPPSRTTPPTTPVPDTQPFEVPGWLKEARRRETQNLDLRKYQRQISGNVTPSRGSTFGQGTQIV